MFIEPLLFLFSGLVLYFTRVENELVFHNYCHVSNSEFGFFRLNEPKLNHVIFLKKFFLSFFSLKFFLLVLGEVHGHDDILIFGILISDSL